MSRDRSLLLLPTALVLGAIVVAAAEARPPSAEERGLELTRQRTMLGTLSLKPVQEELRLTKEQIAKVHRLNEEAQAQFAGVRETEDRRQQLAKTIELARQLDEAAPKQLRDVLHPAQMRRLSEIRMQLRSALDNLCRAEVASRLQLTDAQNEKLAQIRREGQAIRMRLYASMRGPNHRNQAIQSLAQLRRDLDRQAWGLLNVAQQEGFERMKGERFNPPLQRRQP